MIRWCARGVVACVLGLSGLITPAGSASAVSPATQPVSITAAVLDSAAGVRPVQLPHVLGAADFSPGSDRVRYRLEFRVDAIREPLAIYIPKMSLSGIVSLNGVELGSCGPGPLENLRCLHQPQFFTPPKTLWRDGVNLIELEIHATSRQANGLSRVMVGPEQALYLDEFRWRHFGRVTVIDALTWLTLAIAVLSLVIWRVLRSEPLYLWLGLTCIASALSNVNVLVTVPPFDRNGFGWLVFSSRMVSSSLLLLCFLALFRRSDSWLGRALIAFTAVSPGIVWFMRDDPALISLLYVPVLAAGFWLLIQIPRWAWKERRPRDILLAGAYLLLLLSGCVDWFRLRGAAAFEGQYLLAYSVVLMLLILGIDMIRVLAVALATSRDLASMLRGAVAEREESLQQAHARVVEMEQLKARADERGRFVREMHDGFLSNLSITRIALSRGEATVDEAARMVGDCLDDLRLILDASGESGGALEELLADFRHRVESRLLGSGFQFAWDIDLGDAPDLPPSTALQLMRIIQEAVNNAVRHANARAITVAAQWHASSAALSVEVADDGEGMPPESSRRRGRGLSNMWMRARGIGATLEFVQGSPGTRVRLQLSLAQLEPPAPGPRLPA